MSHDSDDDDDDDMPSLRSDDGRMQYYYSVEEHFYLQIDAWGEFPAEFLVEHTHESRDQTFGLFNILQRQRLLLLFFTTQHWRRRRYWTSLAFFRRSHYSFIREE